VAPRAVGHRSVSLVAGLLTVSIVLAGCSAQDASSGSAAGDGTVTVTNCGEQVTFPSPAEQIYVNESQMISNLFALDADDRIATVSGLPPGKQDMLKEIYGDERVDQLPIESTDYATLENVVAASPDTMMAGFGWGYSLEDNLTPDTLGKYDIPAYVSTPTCPQDSGDDEGIMPPWEAIFTDIENIGAIVDRSDAARATITELKTRLDELRTAPTADTSPTVFFFDLTGKSVMSGGNFSPAEAVISAAGGTNALTDVDADFTEVSWETLAASKPDLFLISDYGDGAQSFEAKVKSLKTNPATRDLPAVEESRFLRVPIQMLLGTPLTIDSAELLRQALEKWDLVPASDIEPEIDLPS